jgi:hypothetical protein
MALIDSHIDQTYKKSASALSTVLADTDASNICLSTRVVEHYTKFKKHPHFSKNGSSTGQFFELIFTEALSAVGVSASRQKLHLKHEKTNVEVDVFVVGAKRPIIILLKASLRERWKQEDRDAMAIRHNEKGCATALYEQAGLGKFDDAYAPIIWAVTWREKETVTPEEACIAAKRVGEKCTGINTDRFVSVFDKERMDALVAECKEVQ